MPAKTLTEVTLPFAKFWTWLQAHPNCIVRFGTPEAVLFDDDDLHWHFAEEDSRTLLVQTIRGKKLCGEIAIVPSEIAYVQSESESEEEHRFDLISEGETARVAAYHVVLSHAYDAEEAPKRYTH